MNYNEVINVVCSTHGLYRSNQCGVFNPWTITKYLM